MLGVEELHITPRTILPHGASFHGYPLTLTVRCEALHQEFNVLVRSNCLCVAGDGGWGGGGRGQLNTPRMLFYTELPATAIP